MPNVVDLATQFRRDLISGDEAAQAEMAQRWQQTVEPALMARFEALAEQLAELKAAGVELSESQIYRLARYQELLAQLDIELQRFGLSAAVDIALQQELIAALGIDQAAALMEAVGGLRSSFTVLNRGAVENIVALARAGNPLQLLLEAAYPLAARGITDQLVAGTALGWNPHKTARAMRDEGLSHGLNHMLLVARDQQIRAYRTASLQQYRASGIVTAYKRLSAKQTRTCLACLALDGTLYPTSQMMPLHPQDRCTMIPVLVGSAPTAFETGAEWFRRQTPAVQADMLGPGRFALWQRKAFDFKDLATIVPNATWGPSTQQTSLKVLKERARVRV